MPNWCATTYRVYGDEKQRKKLYSIIEELDKLPEPRVQNGFGNLWLGCIIDYLGGDWNEIACRGDITSYYKTKDYIQIDMETAWRELHEFRHYVEKKLPGLKIYYIADEPGMCEYYTNDKDYSIFHTRYHLDFEDYDSEYFESLEDLAKWMNGIEDHRFSNVEPTWESISAAFEQYQEKNDDVYCQLIEYEYYDVEDDFEDEEEEEEKND